MWSAHISAKIYSRCPNENKCIASPIYTLLDGLKKEKKRKENLNIFRWESASGAWVHIPPVWVSRWAHPASSCASTGAWQCFPPAVWSTLPIQIYLSGQLTVKSYFPIILSPGSIQIDFLPVEISCGHRDAYSTSHTSHESDCVRVCVFLFST